MRGEPLIARPHCSLSTRRRPNATNLTATGDRLRNPDHADGSSGSEANHFASRAFPVFVARAETISCRRHPRPTCSKSRLAGAPQSCALTARQAERCEQDHLAPCIVRKNGIAEKVRCRAIPARSFAPIGSVARLPCLAAKGLGEEEIATRHIASPTAEGAAAERVGWD
jgi:hypothetical protein